ncbi:hypothetical protein, partial [Dysgonomonas sp. 520]|uniref:hypothetical protein n=1 Tax=Dysgonomonas sp. 520 TaxID=2302931 RepID=UPI0013D522E8
SLILLIFLAVTALKAQVGVNTENPQGIFHIDGKRDTNGNTNVADDVVVDTLGRIGVGTNNPQTKVDIRTTTKGSGFRLQDGSQQTGKVLTAMDNTGRAEWQEIGVRITAPSGTFTREGIDIPEFGGHSPLRDTGARLTIPPGKWFVMVSLLAEPSNKSVVPPATDIINAHVYTRTTLSAVNAADDGYIHYDGSSLVGGQVKPYGFTTFSGFFIIRNSHTASIPLRLDVQTLNYGAPSRMWPIIFARAAHLENSIAAFMLSE